MPTNFLAKGHELHGGPVFVGIDPGVKGAIVVLDEAGGLLSACRIPVKLRGKRRRVDGDAVRSAICWRGGARVTIELVGSRPGEGHVGAFTFGHALGVVEGVARGMGLPVRLVEPRMWQASMLRRNRSSRQARVDPGTGNTKERAVAATLERWPELRELLKVKVAWDIADAALIAEWGRCNLFRERLGVSAKLR